MSDEPILITLQDPSGPYQASASTDDRWLKERVATGKGRFRLESGGDDDTEGHAVGNLTVMLRAFGDDDDTEGHAIAVHFPSREEADAFRKRLVLAGVLTGTIALGAAGGIGLSSLNQDASGAASGAATSAQGMDWTQAERKVTTSAASSTQGMDWTQAERPGQAAAATTPTQGMDWTQAERPGQAGAAEDTAPDLRRSGTPTPE